MSDFDVRARLHPLPRGVERDRPRARVAVHGGGQLPTSSLRANWLGEMLVHGYDVAAAPGLAWEMSDADAADLLGLLRGIAPTHGRAGEPVSVEVAVDGAAPWVLVVDRGAMSTRDPGGDASARLTGPGAGAVCSSTSVSTSPAPSGPASS